MVGRADCVVPRAIDHPKASTLDFTNAPGRPERPRRSRRASRSTSSGLPRAPVLPSATDEAVLEGARLSLKYGEPSTVQVRAARTQIAPFGARLAGEIARKSRRARGSPSGTIVVEATGTAGQSFGAFATRGMLIVLEGDANDYVGKGLSGGVLAVRPPARARFKAHENVIVGNTCLYGATSGKAFFAGRAGERFARAQQRRRGGRRGRGRPRLRVHDRRHGRRPRADGAQLRRRDERRRRVRARRRPRRSRVA